MTPRGSLGPDVPINSGGSSNHSDQHVLPTSLSNTALRYPRGLLRTAQTTDIDLSFGGNSGNRHQHRPPATVGPWAWDSGPRIPKFFILDILSLLRAISRLLHTMLLTLLGNKVLQVDPAFSHDCHPDRSLVLSLSIQHIPLYSSIFPTSPLHIH